MIANWQRNVWIMKFWLQIEIFVKIGKFESCDANFLKIWWKNWLKNWSKSTKINFWQFWLILVKSKLTKIEFIRFLTDFCQFCSILVWFLSILTDFGRFYNRHNRLQKSIFKNPPEISLNANKFLDFETNWGGAF